MPPPSTGPEAPLQVRGSGAWLPACPSRLHNSVLPEGPPYVPPDTWYNLARVCTHSHTMKDAVLFHAASVKLRAIQLTRRSQNPGRGAEKLPYMLRSLSCVFHTTGPGEVHFTSGNVLIPLPTSAKSPGLVWLALLREKDQCKGALPTCKYLCSHLPGSRKPLHAENGMRARCRPGRLRRWDKNQDVEVHKGHTPTRRH